MKKLFITGLLLLLGACPAVSQEDDVEAFVSDMLILAGRFSEPAADGAAYQAAGGWFSSASVLETWDLRFSGHANILFVPDEKTRFSVSNEELALLEISGATSAEMPTAFGGASPVMLEGEITAFGQTRSFSFNAIQGSGLTTVPHAFAQLSVGLPSGTELSFRGMPEVTIDGVTASTLGAGLKHSLSQYMGSDDQEDIQVAAGIAYSRLNIEYGFTPTGAEGIVLLDIIDVKADLWLLEAMVSKRWGPVELFGAGGAMNSAFDYEMGGTGPFLETVNTEIQALEEDVVQFKGDLGLNLYFGPFRLSSQARLGEFTNVNLGLHVKI